VVFFVILCVLCAPLTSITQAHISQIEKNFKTPPASAKPWVFWYWMHGAISKQGITADLEAMKQVGIGGAYLMPIKDTTSAIPFQPVARQLSPEWWGMVKFAMQECKRLGLKLAMHVSDGFALAGGPWITPALSMQKLVWSKTYIKGGSEIKIELEKPSVKIDYYKDIAVFAYPANSANTFSDIVLVPSITASNGSRPYFLSQPDNTKETFRSDTTCWVQYKYPRPFTCRSIKIHTGGNNYQAHRLIIQSSDDGINFTTVTRLEPPRHGWQDTDEDVTHAIPTTTARYFRFVYDKDGSEPGAEDLDAAKWRPSLRVMGIHLSDEPVISQYESKNGSVWRVSKSTTKEQVPSDAVIRSTDIINISGKMDKDGRLRWTAPAGNWVIVRIGHTSTGHTNATGGAGKGLECDKFNPVAIKLQFDKWFGSVFKNTDPVLAKEVLKIFHVDSWECGSQNWSPVFAAEFKKRRGYDPVRPDLLAITGVPVQSIENSEKFLLDVRQTIAELINDVFYVTLKKLAAEKGCSFSAESVAPTMVSDGLLHYKNVDLPMGEFWLNSPTHDKPNDMLDAISGAHIYGKNIIQAEAFTSVRMNWAEHPGMLKAIGDRNFAMGINKMVLHVYTHNPWMDRRPGMTLDGVGLYFQRDQTWFKQGKAWIDYLSRCQVLLQMGKPVVDIAVFTGEEVPRRSVLPDRLVSTLPGIFGKQRVEEEKKRLANEGQPLRTIPDGVTHSANMADPEDWIDPLNGYAYDCINPDALMTATVKNGRIVLASGASYAILVIPGPHPMQPNAGISGKIKNKLLGLIKAGAKISDGMIAPYTDPTFEKLGLEKDVDIKNNDHSIAWTHRKTNDADMYFISNQKDEEKVVTISFRITGKVPEIWDPVSCKIDSSTFFWSTNNGHTRVQYTLDANQSVFVIFRKKNIVRSDNLYKAMRVRTGDEDLSEGWKIQFDKKLGGPGEPLDIDRLKSWTDFPDSSVRYYSGTATYIKTFTYKNEPGKKAWLLFDTIYNIATIKVNNIDCGTIWTKPYEVDISSAVKTGLNTMQIEVSNTWANRLIGDQPLPADKRITNTTAPFRLRNKPLLPAGITGRIRIITRTED
jgi:hypothetical protein